MDSEPVYHGVAKCRWCGGRFMRVYQTQWRCESDACFERCVKHAIMQRTEPAEGESPYWFLPLPFQVDVNEAKVPNLLVAGAAGISKSFGGRMGLYSECKQIPGLRCLLLRLTYGELEENHLQFMDAEAKALGGKYSGGNVRKMEIFHEGDESSIIKASYCDDESDIKRQIGQEWDRIVFEEGVHFLPDAINEIAPRARGSATARAAKIRMGLPLDGQTRVLTNPGGRAMAYLVDFYVKRDPDPDDYPEYERDNYGYITGTLEDNPYLAEDYERKRLSGLKAARYRQLRHGDWSVMVGEFFGAYDEERHVARLEEVA